MCDIQILEGEGTFIYGYIELAVFECLSLSYLSFPECICGTGFLRKRVHYHVFSASILLIPTLCKYVYTECWLIYTVHGVETQCITDTLAVLVLNILGSSSLLV